MRQVLGSPTDDRCHSIALCTILIHALLQFLQKDGVDGWQLREVGPNTLHLLLRHQWLSCHEVPLLCHGFHDFLLMSAQQSQGSRRKDTNGSERGRERERERGEREARERAAGVCTGECAHVLLCLTRKGAPLWGQLTSIDSMTAGEYSLTKITTVEWSTAVTSTLLNLFAKQ